MIIIDAQEKPCFNGRLRQSFLSTRKKSSLLAHHPCMTMMMMMVINMMMMVINMMVITMNMKMMIKSKLLLRQECQRLQNHLADAPDPVNH